MRRIRTQLNILFIAILTLVMTGTGAVSYWQTRTRLEGELNYYRDSLRARLETVLPGILWNLDDKQLGKVLDAEMRSTNLQTVEVFSGKELLTGRTRAPTGDVIVLSQSSGHEGMFSFPIDYQEGRVKQSLGHVELELSTKPMQAQLRQQLFARLQEIILLNVLALLALSTSLQQIVIRPLSTLRDKLRQIASRTESHRQIELPDHGYTEFAEITDGFNRIARRMRDDLDTITQTEMEMRVSKERAEQALQQLKMAQTSLIQAEKMASLGNLVAGVAHEINTPVGVMLTSASVLHEDTQQFAKKVGAGTIKKSELLSYSETAQQSAALIMNNATRAAGLIQSFKRVAVDQTSEERREFLLGQYLHEVLVSTRPLFKHTCIEARIDCPDNIQLDSFPGALSQIMTNLLSNAVMHAFGEVTPQTTGLITIRAEAHEGAVRIDFSDNGNGIEQEILGKIFDPFFTTKRAKGGSGLGLNIVYNLVTQTLGGTILVNSTPGEGTTFSIDIPLVAKDVEKTD